MNYTFDHLKEAMDKNHATRQDFLKTLLTIASGMLTILAAFHTATSTESIIQCILFLTTLVLLSLGILAGGIVLYFDVVAAKSIFVQMKQVLSKPLSARDATSDIASYDPPIFFYICEKTCYISLFLAVLSIAFYTGFRI